MADNYDQQIKSLEKQYSSAKTTLEKSPTALATGAAPTGKDLVTDSRVKSLETRLDQLKNDKLKEQWYGKPGGKDDTASGGEGAQPGFMGRTLNALSTPLYGLVGGVEAATGQGSKSGFANIAANIDERDTFSDLLKRNNVPYLLAAPLGFALDVAFDPVNWATAGTASVIPRAAYGLAKGTAKGGLVKGLEAAGKGAAYGFTGAGSAALGMTGFGKTGLRQSLKKTTEKYVKDFDEITGRDVIQNATRGGGIGITLPGDGNDYRFRIGDAIKNSLESIPGGSKLWQAFDYNNANYIKLSKYQDTLERSHGASKLLPDEPNLQQAEEFAAGIPISSPEARAQADAITGSANEFDMRNLGSFENTLPMDNLPRSVNPGTVGARADSLVNDTNFISGNPQAVRTLDPVEQNARFADEIADEAVDKEIMQQLMDEYERPGNKTGIKFYDDAVEKVKDFKIKDVAVGANTLNALGSFTNAFKLSKLGLSPSTHFANAVSAIPIGMMAGFSGESFGMGKGLSGRFFSNLSLLSGNPKAANRFIKELGDAGEQGARWVQYMKENGQTYARVYGEAPEYIAGKGFVDQIMQTGKDAGLINATNEQEVFESLDKYMLWLRDKTRQIDIDEKAGADVSSGLLGIAKNAKKKAASSPDETARRFAEEGMADPRTVAITGAEFNDDTWLRAKLNDLSDAAQAEDATVGIKVLDAFLNKSMSVYGRIDQAWRMSFAQRMTIDGLSERELRTMSNVFPFKKDDIVGKTTDNSGVQRFLISPDKATELSADILFNYAAMPAAVRMLRAVPILGAPFASFMYGMALRTAQTFAYNPGAFNRINFAMNAYSGEKGPIEKQALESKYYSWYKDPTMMRLPFFEEFPLYLNTANVLPYYSMNMFDPPQRKYENLLPETVSSIVDKSPFLKDPIGQMMFDYFIMPSMIRDEQPLNSFGAPLFPPDSTGLEKAGYALRSVSDTLTPNLVAPLGLAAGAAIPESASYLPGYRTRQMANAIQGKNSLGIEGKEDVASRVNRALAGYAGIPIQRLDPRAAASEVKKTFGQ